MKSVILGWASCIILIGLLLGCHWGIYNIHVELKHRITNYQTQLSDVEQRVLVLSDKGQQLTRELQDVQGAALYLRTENTQLKKDLVEKDNLLIYYQKRLLMRPFVSGQEFEAKMKYYQSGMTYLGGQCVAIAQALVYCAHKDGYEAETEILESRNHAVVKAYIGTEIWLYDYETNYAWQWR